MVLEPWVDLIHHVLPSSICASIIDEAEKVGFPLEVDSIDNGEEYNQASWAIDVVYEGKVVQPSLSTLYEPYRKQLDDIVRTHKRAWSGSLEEPELGWVFLRKYQAGQVRNQLKLHHDINLFTVNVALNGVDDYEGGGLFYHKSRASYHHYEDDKSDDEHHPIPNFPLEMLSYDYLANSVKSDRRNTSEIVFPAMETGDVLIHNYTLHHAIAPLTKGTRYSLVFFYDMDNPDVQGFVSPPQTITIRNGYYDDIEVVLYYVDEYSQQMERIAVHDPLPKEAKISSYVGHRFDAYSKQTDELLDTVVVQEDVGGYVIGGGNSQQRRRKRRKQIQQPEKTRGRQSTREEDKDEKEL